MRLSIIIPTLNEAPVLERTLRCAQGLSQEIIISDGGSQDETVSLAYRYTPHVMQSPRGRGVQLDRGARFATGDVLLFLHADTLLPPDAHRVIVNLFKDRAVVYGAFPLAIDSPGPLFTGIAFVANLRTKVLKMPYGDQAIFVRRSVYFKVGGIRHWPLMEDVDFVRRLNREGKFGMAPLPVLTSARRWRQERPLFTTLRNWSLQLRYFLGVPPEKLARHYRDQR